MILSPRGRKWEEREREGGGGGERGEEGREGERGGMDGGREREQDVRMHSLIT